MRILVLGASGMLGNAILRVLSEWEELKVYGTLRKPNAALNLLAPRAQLISGIEVNRSDDLVEVFTKSRPNVVINCVGLVKQLVNSNDPLQAIPVNGLLPHRLAKLCEFAQARLVHFSTDCVFSGKTGFYSESDVPDAEDIYGRSKLIGEVNYPHSITLRTSIIGHEIEGARGLIGWFLAQRGSVKGYINAIFSGLPTYELAQVVKYFIIPNVHINGIYHVAADPISKFDLLSLVNQVYGKGLKIEVDDKVNINRSLNASRFNSATNYSPPAWSHLIKKMYDFK